MFALERLIAEQLAQCAELADWSVRRGSELVSARVAPSVVVRLDGAGVGDSKATAANVAVRWAIHLVVERGDGATDQLDAAFAAVIASLLNWAPPKVADRQWSPFRLAAVGTPDSLEQGLLEYAVLFQTASIYNGKP